MQQQLAQHLMKSSDIQRLRRQVVAVETGINKAILAMLPVAARFGAALQNFDDTVRANYRRAGAPYGDTAEGRYRWLREVTAEIRRRHPECFSPR